MDNFCALSHKMYVLAALTASPIHHARVSVKTMSHDLFRVKIITVLFNLTLAPGPMFLC